MCEYITLLYHSLLYVLYMRRQIDTYSQMAVRKKCVCDLSDLDLRWK